MENKNSNLDEEAKVLKMAEELNEIMKEKGIEETENPVDKLFDETNNDPIYLYSEKGEMIGFEQIALIPLKADTYAILKPIKPIDGVGEDEGLVFEIKADKNGNEYLKLVVSENVIDDVFEVYDRLCEEEQEEED
ncbi:MAG: DUF1292 domain-containing protein [Clostridia bacterium]|nr:DUF1292 domain-containing protein [Clostridia bacterium]